jgi:hypothetical protein
MKSDEDVWISQGTKASRPDESGPDRGRSQADSVIWARQGRRRGRGRTECEMGCPAGFASSIHTLAIQVEMGLLRAVSAVSLLGMTHAIW